MQLGNTSMRKDPGHPGRGPFLSVHVVLPTARDRRRTSSATCGRERLESRGRTANGERRTATGDLNVGGVGPDTGHAWTRRNSVALEPFVPNRIGTYGPDRTDPSHVQCNWDPRGSGRRWAGPLDQMPYLKSGLQGISRDS